MKLTNTNFDLALDLKKQLGQHLLVTFCASHRTRITKEPTFSRFRGGYLTFDTAQTFNTSCSAFPAGAGGLLPTYFDLCINSCDIISKPVAPEKSDEPLQKGLIIDC